MERVSLRWRVRGVRVCVLLFLLVVSTLSRADAVPGLATQVLLGPANTVAWGPLGNMSWYQGQLATLGATATYTAQNINYTQWQGTVIGWNGYGFGTYGTWFGSDAASLPSSLTSQTFGDLYMQMAGYVYLQAGANSLYYTTDDQLEVYTNGTLNVNAQVNSNDPGTVTLTAATAGWVPINVYWYNYMGPGDLYMTLNGTTLGSLNTETALPEPLAMWLLLPGLLAMLVSPRYARSTIQLL